MAIEFGLMLQENASALRSSTFILLLLQDLATRGHTPGTTSSPCFRPEGGCVGRADEIGAVIDTK